MIQKKLMWIEDDALRLEAMVYPLKQIGYEIILSFDAEDAIEKMEMFHDEICLLIIDLILPPGDLDSVNYGPYIGLDLIKLFRSHNINIPIIVFTVVDKEEVMLELRKLKVRKVLQKGRLLPKDIKKEVIKVCKDKS